MSDEQLWTRVDEYIEAHLIGSDDALQAALETNRARALPSIDVAPNQGKLLYLLAGMLGARRVLEIGTLGGYSTIWLARALPPDGRLLSLELEPRHAEVARENVARAGLASLVDVKVGPALESLEALEQSRAEPFDFVFIDADKANIPEYFTRSLALTRPGGVIVVDNVVRKGALVAADTIDPNVRGVQRFHELLQRTPHVSATTLQTVGKKGYDGFTLVRVAARSSARP